MLPTIGQLSDTFSDIQDWLYAPFTEQQDMVNWLLLIAMACAIAYGWKMILDNVLEQ